MTLPMHIGSLFSGIGGLELGLEWAGLGPVRWQVEQSDYCRAVLERHWPEASRYDDVRAVGADLAPVDLICGGFPCQDVSSAGARKGLAGDRSGLWGEFARVVGVLRPRWVVVENVASGATLWLDAVVRELGELGYAALPVPLSAADVGAPHRRARIFVIASDADSERREPGARGTRAERPGGAVADRGAAADADRDGQPGISVNAEVARASEAGDAVRSGRKGLGPGARQARRGRPATPAWRPPVPDFLRVADGLSRGLGSPRRRIAALGNSVVPQCAEVIGWMVRELAAEQALARMARKEAR